MNASVFRPLVSGLCASVCLLVGATVQAADYKLTSLEWPPYSGSRLAAQGVLSAVVSDAFKAAGRSVKIEFFPWNRAVDIARNNKDYVAYFPEYHATAKESECLYSDPVGHSPLVLVERKANPLRWNSYDDLSGRKIGVVKGYLNTEELDARIASRVLAVDHALDDARNILKLAAGRVDAAVIDLNVFNYLVKNDASVKAVAGPLQVNAKFLEDKKLFVCFTRSPEGDTARQAFNLGLRKIDVDAVFRKKMN